MKRVTKKEGVPAVDEGSRPGPAPAAARGRASVFVADEQADAEPLSRETLEQLRKLASYVLSDQRVPEAMEVSILCADANDIARLNARHMGASGPTDVLAFPMDQPGETMGGETAILGDVVLCPAVARVQAPVNGHTFIEELELLVVHGILHLLGHDHADPDEQAVMFGLTDRLLAGFRGEVA